MACSTSFLTSLLENYWPEMNMALSKINPISVSSKRILYKPGDPLTHIYLLLHGYMFLSIAHEQLKLSPGQLVGEYQAQIGSTSRMTMLLVGKGAQFLQLPFSYYQSINQNYHHNNMFLNDVVGGLDRKLKYVVSKMFTLKKIKRD